MVRDRRLIPQVLFVFSSRKQLQTPSLPPFIFLKFFLRFSLNPSPPYIFLKLSLRFSKNEITDYVKNLDILISFCHTYEDPRNSAKEMYEVSSKGLLMIYATLYGIYNFYIQLCITSSYLYISFMSSTLL